MIQLESPDKVKAMDESAEFKQAQAVSKYATQRFYAVEELPPSQ